MPVNYDEFAAGEDWSFVIRGETFTYKPVPYTILAQIEELQKTYMEKGDPGTAAAYEFSMSRLLLMLSPEEGEKFRALCENAETPVTYRELTMISKGGFELMTGLPTTPPTPSEAGRGKTGGSLKAA